MDETPAGYPRQWELHAVLNDGATVAVRPIRPGDREALSAFHQRQSAESIYFRFFRHRPELSDRELDYFTQVDYLDRMAFVAIDGEQLVGVGRYETLSDGRRAEVAFFIDDRNHGRGLATLLLEYLAAAARVRGLERLTATVLPENYSMLAVFRRAGLDVRTAFADGAIDVDISLEVTAKATSAMLSRQRRARVRSVGRMLAPENVLLVGASRRQTAVGYRLAERLVGRRDDSGFDGGVYLVNRAASGEAEHPVGKKLFGDVAAAAEALAADLDDEDARFDLAVLAVPASEVAATATACAEAGVRSLAAIAAGFSESGTWGASAEADLVSLVRDHGMRLLGPNGSGVANPAPDVRLKAVALPVEPTLGNLGLASDSGPLGAALIEQFRQSGLGLSGFAGVGNQADVAVSDLLDYWSVDDATVAIVCYVEQLDTPGFAEVARQTARTKPVILRAPADGAAAARLRQAGCILVDEVSQLIDQAELAATQPVPNGNRVVVVSNTASLARLAASACRTHGLKVVVPVSGQMPPNDLDHDGEQNLGAYERVAVASAVSEEVDAVMVALAPTSAFALEDLRLLLDRINRAVDKPIVAVGLVSPELVPVPNLPLYTFPEAAARALGRWVDYGQWRNRAASEAEAAAESEPEAGTKAGGDEQPSEAPASPLAQLEDLLDRTGHPGDGETVTVELTHPLAAEWIDLFEVPAVPNTTVVDGAGLVEAAEALGFPVVLKVNRSAIDSVGERGGVAIDLYDGGDLLAANRRMRRRFGDVMAAATVQQMVFEPALYRVELGRADGKMHAEDNLTLTARSAGRVGRSEHRYLPLGEAEADELVSSVVPIGKPGSQEATALRALIQRSAMVFDSSAEIRSLSLDLVPGEQADGQTPPLAVLDIGVVVGAIPSNPLSEVRAL